MNLLKRNQLTNALYMIPLLVIELVRTTTVSTGQGDSILITWDVPKNANNLFVYLGNTRDAMVLATISKGEVSYVDKLRKERFGDRLNIKYSNNIIRLTINDSEKGDEGTYTAIAQFGMFKITTLRSYHVEITVNSPHKSASLDSGLSSSDAGIIVGIVIAIVSLIVILILIRYCYDRNHSLANQLSDISADEETKI